MKNLVVVLLSFFSLGSYGQLAFEILPFPDSLKPSAVVVNDEGIMFVSSYSFADDGILKSSDNGETWEFVYQMAGHDIRDMKVNQAEELYAIINSSNDDSSLLISVNSGDSWEKRYFPQQGVLHNEKIFLKGSDTIFISQSLSNSVRLITSNDNGYNWQTIFETNTPSGERLTDLAISENGDLYTSLYGFWETSGGIYKSVDDGLTWQFLGFRPSQITDLEFNSSGDLWISGRGSGIFVIYNDTDTIVAINTTVSTSGLVINSSDDIFVGHNGLNILLHSSDGLTFENITHVMPGECPISALYKDSEEFLYAIMEGTPYIAKSIVSTITSALNELPGNKATVYVDADGNHLTAFVGLTTAQTSTYQIITSAGNIVATGTCQIFSGKLEIKLPNLSPGVYFIRLIAEGQIFTGKFYSQ